jgi:hypothetical protein
VFSLSILHVVKELNEFGMVNAWSKDCLTFGGAIFCMQPPDKERMLLEKKSLAFVQVMLKFDEIVLL